MPIGIIIITVMSLIALIAAKCCGVKIDPVGKIKKFWNDIRDRWKWLDTVRSGNELHITVLRLNIFHLCRPPVVNCPEVFSEISVMTFVSFLIFTLIYTLSFTLVPVPPWHNDILIDSLEDHFR